MNNWADHTLENILENLIDYRGKTPKKSTSGVRLVTAKVIKDGFINDEPAEYISDDIYDEWMTRGLPQKGDVLITTEAPLGEVAQLRTNEKIALAQRVILLRGNEEKLNNDFLFHSLKSDLVQQRIQARATGTTVKGIKQSELRQVLIPLPSIENQKRIASILNDFDRLILNNHKRIKILEEMAQSIYEEWFVHFKFPGHEKVKMIDSEFGKVPEGWHFVKASEVIDFDPKTIVDRNLENKYLPMGSISESSMIISNIEMRKGNSGSKFQNKDTLLARISPSLENGKTGFVNFLKESETAFGSTEFIVMRSKSVCPEYVYCLARSSRFRGLAIKSMRGATGRQRVQRDALENFRIALPNDGKLVNEFHSILEPMFDQIYLLNTKNEVLVKTRDLLLPRLISGEIVL